VLIDGRTGYPLRPFFYQKLSDRPLTGVTQKRLTCNDSFQAFPFIPEAQNARARACRFLASHAGEGLALTG
jgi:hypothetical protein